jgi:hypothetical protein
MTERKKRPRDFAQRAKMIVDIATGEIEDREPTPEEQDKDLAAVSLGRRVLKLGIMLEFGRVGGAAEGKSAVEWICSLRNTGTAAGWSLALSR